MSEQTRSDEAASVDVDELRRLLADATPGPWYVDDMDRIYVGNRADGRRSGLWEIVYASSERTSGLVPEARERVLRNAALIVAAVNALPSLLAENESLRAQVADLQAQLERVTKARDDYKRIADDEGERVNRLYYERAHLRDALIDLVRLKDGPRDDAYRAAKDAAWTEARNVLLFPPCSHGFNDVRFCTHNDCTAGDYARERLAALVPVPPPEPTAPKNSELYGGVLSPMDVHHYSRGYPISNAEHAWDDAPLTKCEHGHTTAHRLVDASANVGCAAVDCTGPVSPETTKEQQQ